MRLRAAVVLLLVGIVLSIAALAGPWWIVTLDASSSFGGSVFNVAHDVSSFYLDHGVASYNTTLDGSWIRTTDYNTTPAVRQVLHASQTLMLLGGGTALLASILDIVPSRRRWTRLASVLAACMAALFGFGATLSIVGSIPTAMNEQTGANGTATAVHYTGFWGVQNPLTPPQNFPGTIAWSAGWGWYLAMLAASLFAIACIAALIAHIATRRRSPAS